MASGPLEENSARASSRSAKPSTPAPRGPTESNSPRLKRRPRKLDQPILEYIGHFGAVTSYQILDRFFTDRGKSPVYGYRVLKQLRELGLVTSAAIHPELGAASLSYLRLTEAGWLAIGIHPTSEQLREPPRPRLEYLLQHGEMMFVRAAQGWREVRSEVAFERLRSWALGLYRDRMLNDRELLHRSTLERMEPIALPVPLLLNIHTGQVRLVLPIREGENIRRILNRLPDMALFPRIGFELVCGDPELLGEARGILQRFAEREGFAVELHQTSHFTSRPNPRSRRGRS